MKNIHLKSLEWQALNGWVNGRSERERLLMLTGFLFLLYTIVSHSLIPFLQAGQNQASQTVDTYLAQIAKRGLDIYQQSDAFKQDSNFATAIMINDLAKQISNYDPRLNEISRSIVEPKEMLPFIKTLLHEQHLRIRHIENDPPEVVTPNNKNDNNIYKHGVYLETNGNYLDHIRFLKKLEQMPWHIFWDKFQLNVDKDGSVTVGLEISTLNFKSNWLEI